MTERPCLTSRFVSCFLASVFCLLVSTFFLNLSVSAQTSTATLTGEVTDQRGAVIPGATVTVVNTGTGARRQTTTNGDGYFIVPLLPPSSYTVTVETSGFAPVLLESVVLNVGDQRAVQIQLTAGTISEMVKITGDAPLINESPAVGTVVDQQFVANIPLNGRSFQQLIALTPGVVLTKANGTEQGQFSVNGQRADANYFTVDGVSANVGVNPNFTPGQSLGGAVPGFSVGGGTNSLVSVDALQEFKVQTSSYAPEFGRSPGGQFSIATRSGTKDFHGTVFDYIRNDVFDANDWFGNRSDIAKPKLRQNDFGFVLGGPVFLPRFGEGGRSWYNGKNHSFFFLSYEGLRLRQPRVSTTSVPSLFIRQTAPSGLRPMLNAFPLPTGPDIVNPTTGLRTGFARFVGGFSDPSKLDSTSIRIDQSLSSRFTLFGRYNHSPSDSSLRVTGIALSVRNPFTLRIQTLTLGTLFSPTSNVYNDLRFNYTKNTSAQSFELDNFGGAVVPPDSALFSSYPSSGTRELAFNVTGGDSLILGLITNQTQQQINLVDTLTLVKGPHELKFGADYRRLSPTMNPRNYIQSAAFSGMGVTASGLAPAGTILSGVAQSATVTASFGPLFPIFTNVSIFAQDTWKIGPRVLLTYGARWEVNPAPSERNGNLPVAIVGLDNPATATLALAGTKAYQTTYRNLAPRVGLAYSLIQSPGREMIVRGGFGIFYDLGNQHTATAFFQFPFSALTRLTNVAYPLTPSQAAPPSLNPNRLVDTAFVSIPHLELPRTYQWNMAVEQSFGPKQIFTASYVGALGRRLLRQERLSGTALGGNLNPAVFTSNSGVVVVRNTATSDYHALQLQFQRRLSRGLQALASYTWSHSIDIASSDSTQGTPVAAVSPLVDRGSSDFDVRHTFSGALTYDIPSPGRGSVGKAILGGWSANLNATARSATPINITYTAVSIFGFASLRPDLVSGVPVFLSDPTMAGGKRINPAAFSRPIPARQGNLARNGFRGFPAWQVDFGLNRQFHLHERLNLDFRSEFFNIFNHPNFADPVGNLALSQFGQSTSMLARSLGQGGASGGFNSLYQIGGPRSVQFALKLLF